MMSPFLTPLSMLPSDPTFHLPSLTASTSGRLRSSKSRTNIRMGRVFVMISATTLTITICTQDTQQKHSSYKVWPQGTKVSTLCPKLTTSFRTRAEWRSSQSFRHSIRTSRKRNLSPKILSTISGTICVEMSKIITNNKRFTTMRLSRNGRGKKYSTAKAFQCLEIPSLASTQTIKSSLFY